MQWCTATGPCSVYRVVLMLISYHLVPLRSSSDYHNAWSEIMRWIYNSLFSQYSAIPTQSTVMFDHYELTFSSQRAGFFHSVMYDFSSTAFENCRHSGIDCCTLIHSTILMVSKWINERTIEIDCNECGLMMQPSIHRTASRSWHVYKTHHSNHLLHLFFLHTHPLSNRSSMHSKASTFWLS